MFGARFRGGRRNRWRRLVSLKPCRLAQRRDRTGDALPQDALVVAQPPPAHSFFLGFGVFAGVSGGITGMTRASQASTLLGAAFAEASRFSGFFFDFSSGACSALGAVTVAFFSSG